MPSDERRLMMDGNGRLATMAFESERDRQRAVDAGARRLRLQLREWRDVESAVGLVDVSAADFEEPGDVADDSLEDVPVAAWGVR